MNPTRAPVVTRAARAPFVSQTKIRPLGVDGFDKQFAICNSDRVVFFKVFRPPL